MHRELTISRLGSQGDGLAQDGEGPIYIPFALPGERIVADIDSNRGRLIDVLKPSPERGAPICRHFGICGGCALQHLDWSAYLRWKRQRIVEALTGAGIDAPVAEIRAFGPHSRRRATFTAEKTGKALELGYRRAQSHELVDLEKCPILMPALEAVIPGLRELLARLLPPGEARILVTACNNGLDVNIETVKGRIHPLTPSLSEVAQALGILRITAGDDPIFSIAAPQVALAGVSAELPPRAFLQASAEAEAAMAELAVEALGKARKVVDLYAGLGAFTFALARKTSVTAVELDRQLLTELERAAKRAQGLKPITTKPRNLAREPLSLMELKAFDAALFDPPRAGAQSQARLLAKSRIRKIVAVSCNPDSFARDARLLIDGGYDLTRVVPIDQFVFSPHVELIAMFARSR